MHSYRGLPGAARSRWPGGHALDLNLLIGDAAPDGLLIRERDVETVCLNLITSYNGRPRDGAMVAAPEIVMDEASLPPGSAVALHPGPGRRLPADGKTDMNSNPRIPFRLSSDRPPLAGPDGKRLIVHIAVNIEYWPIERPMPRGILPAPHGAPPAPPDVPNFSWVEYGLRCGMPRILDMLSRRGLPASAFLNAQVADIYPSLMDAVIDAGWELVGHGWFQQSLKQAGDEADVIRRSLDRLEEAGGTRPRAWLGPGLGESEDTPDVLRAEGIEFLHDWVLDDLPVWMRTAHGPMIALPYTFELNDVPIYAIQNGSTDEYLKRVEATLAVFARETRRQPRVLTLALHPHIIGVPHVAHHLEQALDLLTARDDTVFMTSSPMGDWFAAADPGGAEAVR